MLISGALYYSVVIGAIVLGLIIVGACRVVALKSANAGRPKLLLISAAVFFGMLFAGYKISQYYAGNAVTIVQAENGKPVKRSYRLYGSYTYTLGNSTTVTLTEIPLTYVQDGVTYHRDSALQHVLNDTSRPIRVYILYGYGLGQIINPGSIVEINGVIDSVDFADTTNTKE